MTITLEVKPREDNVSAKSLRANGSVPAVIYGQNQEATAVVLDAKVFEKVRKEAGDSTIVELAASILILLLFCVVNIYPLEFL